MTSETNYTTYVFDFDGVIANSNNIKRNCFFKIGNLYDKPVSNQFKQYCEDHPGATRYEKMQWLEKKLDETGLDVSWKELVDQYSYCVKSVLPHVECAEDLPEVKASNSETTWSIVSAAPEKELLWFLDQKGWLELFEDGVYGAPRSKNSVFREEYDAVERENKMVFFGDSQSDLTVAKKLGIDFVFVRQWARDPDVADLNNVPSVETVETYFR